MLFQAETDDGYMHIQIYVKSEDVDPSLTGYESGKKLEDELVQVGKHRPVTLPAAIEPKPIHGHHGKHKPVPLPAMIGPKPKPGQPGKQKPVPPPFVGPKPGPGHSCCDCGELPPKRLVSNSTCWVGIWVCFIFLNAPQQKTNLAMNCQ